MKDNQKCCHHDHDFVNKTEMVAKGSFYSCPMHPQIRQKTPGSCPICGMALEAESVVNGDDNHFDEELLSLKKRFIIALILTLPVFILEMGGHFFEIAPAKVSQAMQLVFSSVVVFYSGSIFFRKAFESLKNKSLNMFTLIAIGTGVSWFYSLFAFFLPDFFPAELLTHDGVMPVYFEAASVITTLVLLGQVLEVKARKSTSGSISALIKLTATVAYRINGDGEEEVAVENLKIGDLLRVRPGDKIPADGEIVEGSSNIDESMITGESMPIKKTAGSIVIGATINQDGSFVMKVLKLSQNSMLSQIIQMVLDAKKSQTQIQKLVDQVSSWFVPLVIGIAILTFAIWLFFLGDITRALISAVAVLIIACPCALGLATPMSIIAALGVGAKNGILIKNAESLEKMQKIDLIVVDKTGTLTEGKPNLTKIITANDFDEKEVLSFAASLENQSEHPLAKAICNFAKEKNIAIYKAEDFSTPIGKGVAGKVEGKEILIGNLNFLQEHDVDCQDLKERAQNMAKDGATVIFIAIDGKLAAIFAIEDAIKSTSFDAIKKLQNLDLKIVMLTGDNRKTAQKVADQLGITEVFAEVLPDGKSKIIADLKENGEKVAMVGDGINDAPALVMADVGIAVANGTDVAIESAGIVLLQGDLAKLVKAYNLSKKTMRNIKENLFFAFAYNALGIPLASGLFGFNLSPAIAAAAMSLSSLSVILNSLRLRRIKL